MNDYKIVLLGSGGVGKSALTVQFVSGVFVESYDPTIEDFYVKKIRVLDEMKSVEILDTAGIEQFSCMRDLYIKNGNGFVIVYSIASEKSFHEIKHLKEHIMKIKTNSKVPIVLVGNKVDLASTNREVKRSSAEKLAMDWNCPFFETSAKKNVAVNDSFQRLIDNISKTACCSKSNANNQCCLIM